MLTKQENEDAAQADLRTLAGRISDIVDTLSVEYSRKHNFPWVVAYSGGKDSTLLLQLMWETVAAMPVGRRLRKVYIVGNDTLVESPLVIDHMRTSLSRVGAAADRLRLPIEAVITRPSLDQTFWVNVIGRGYVPPTRNFRWCTDRMKILPTNRLLNRLVEECGKVILLVGTRKSESHNRRRTMERHGASASAMNRHSTIKDCLMFTPLANLTDEEVWHVLMQRKAPWGTSHRKLVTLYRNAKGGECPLILSKDDAPSCGTTSPRFGCWTCTVIKKDRSLQGLIASGHEDSSSLTHLAAFRDWIIDLREDRNNRQAVRRDGSKRVRSDGSTVMGPFKISVREQILAELKLLEAKIDSTLITDAEIVVIQDIWRRDKIQEKGRETLVHSFSGMGK